MYVDVLVSQEAVVCQLRREEEEEEKRKMDTCQCVWDGLVLGGRNGKGREEPPGCCDGGKGVCYVCGAIFMIERSGHVFQKMTSRTFLQLIWQF